MSKIIGITLSEPSWSLYVSLDCEASWGFHSAYPNDPKLFLCLSAIKTHSIKKKKKKRTVKKSNKNEGSKLGHFSLDSIIQGNVFHLQLSQMNSFVQNPTIRMVSEIYHAWSVWSYCEPPFLGDLGEILWDLCLKGTHQHVSFKVILLPLNCLSSFPSGSDGNAAQKTWVWFLDWEDPLKREGLPIPVFLPGEFHEQRSLAGYSPWTSKELDTTEQLTHYSTWFSQSSLFEISIICVSQKTLGSTYQSLSIIEGSETTSPHIYWVFYVVSHTTFL